MSIKDLEEDILEVWGKHTEFSAKGNRYVAFVLQKQIDEMIEAKFSDESMKKELADMALVILRYFSRRGISSEKVIRARLDNRHNGKTDQIKDKYLKLYEKYNFPTYLQWRCEFCAFYYFCQMGRCVGFLPIEFFTTEETTIVEEETRKIGHHESGDGFTLPQEDYKR